MEEESEGEEQGGGVLRVGLRQPGNLHIAATLKATRCQTLARGPKMDTVSFYLAHEGKLLVVIQQYCECQNALLVFWNVNQ